MSRHGFDGDGDGDADGDGDGLPCLRYQGSDTVRSQRVCREDATTLVINGPVASLQQRYIKIGEKPSCSLSQAIHCALMSTFAACLGIFGSLVLVSDA
jgi:hypothetical protein